MYESVKDVFKIFLNDASVEEAIEDEDADALGNAVISVYFGPDDYSKGIEDECYEALKKTNIPYAMLPLLFIKWVELHAGIKCPEEWFDDTDTSIGRVTSCGFSYVAMYNKNQVERAIKELGLE